MEVNHARQLRRGPFFRFPMATLEHHPARVGQLQIRAPEPPRADGELPRAEVFARVFCPRRSDDGVDKLSVALPGHLPVRQLLFLRLLRLLRLLLLLLLLSLAAL